MLPNCVRLGYCTYHVKTDPSCVGERVVEERGLPVSVGSRTRKAQQNGSEVGVIRRVVEKQPGTGGCSVSGWNANDDLGFRETFNTLG